MGLPPLGAPAMHATRPTLYGT
ncbi:MAG: hypothetical protein JWP04_1718, partial [Belnapia sp.]|nr:hypothetical protein [Belnapia sp.]